MDSPIIYKTPYGPVGPATYNMGRRPSSTPSAFHPPLSALNYGLPQAQIHGGMSLPAHTNPYMTAPVHGSPAQNMHHENDHHPYAQPTPSMYARTPDGAVMDPRMNVHGYPQGVAGSAPARVPRQYMDHDMSFESTGISNSAPEESASEIHALKLEVKSLLADVNDLRVSNAVFESRLSKAEGRIETLSGGGTAGSTSVKTKNIAREHPSVRALVFDMFWHLLNIPADLNHDEKIAALPDPLPTLEANEVTEDGQRIWHPDWTLNVSKGVNVAFLTEITNLVYNNEEAVRGAGKKGRLEDKSFEKPIIRTVATDYFRNIKSARKRASTPEGQQKAEEQRSNGRRRGRRQNKTIARRNAIPALEKQFGITGVIALLDTDYASSEYSMSASDIGSEIEERIARQKVGRFGTWAKHGKQWRRKKYIKLLRALDYLSSRPSSHKTQAQPVDGDGESAIKKRKLNEPGRKRRNAFDLSPEVMNPRPPASSKSDPTVPCVGMDPRNNEPTTRSNPEWWGALTSGLCEENFFAVDWDYLGELPEDTDDEDTAGNTVGVTDSENVSGGSGTQHT
ncbi:hypothetical protein PLICRDRAFT_174853 [Plicaturopsis crispa FD-325 SS-3]|nr:hypothetical protein PLICRDRAFT_174853 [Plicaturopsis crispa FD-325 SS-3]